MADMRGVNLASLTVAQVAEFTAGNWMLLCRVHGGQPAAYRYQTEQGQRYVAFIDGVPSGGMRIDLTGTDLGNEVFSGESVIARVKISAMESQVAKAGHTARDNNEVFDGNKPRSVYAFNRRPAPRRLAWRGRHRRSSSEPSSAARSWRYPMPSARTRHLVFSRSVRGMAGQRTR